MTDKLTIADIRATKQCSTGIRDHFLGRGRTKSQVLYFLRNGMPLEEARKHAKNNGDVAAAVAVADKRIAKEKADKERTDNE